MNSGKKLKALLKLFQSGEKIESLDDLQSRLESPTEKTLLRRASLLRHFDKDIFAKLLHPRDASAKISFAQFTRHADLELVPRTDNIFRVKENIQQKYLQEWSGNLSADKPDNKIFLGNLISYYESDEPKYELDLLGALVLTDPPRAEKKFTELFDKADANFDLAACNDVLRVLEERQTLLKPGTTATDEINKLCRQKRQYLKARSLFAVEYYQTGFYYARRQIVKAFDRLLKNAKTDSSKWIFHLYATGGMGKTMFVRWLVARHCVPEPRRIPVARLDFEFDSLHLPTVERFPWLLILVIAEQLNQQIEGNPFNEFLSNYLPLASLARPPKDPGDRSRTDKDDFIQKISPPEVDTIVRNFIVTLKKFNGEKPFVVVLDTLERMVLHYKSGLLAVLKQIELIHAEYKQTRLLLVGRYNLQERLTEFKTQFETQTVVHELMRFNARESRSYLAEKRGLQEAAIVKAIIKKCEEEKTGDRTAKRGSNPFKLSLVADFYQQEIVKTPQDIASLEQMDIEYLINRIITHIKEPTVQWLLRYAVVPRRFTFDIFKEVLAPHLTEELINTGKLDDPNRNFPKGAEKFENQTIWKPLGDEDRHLLDYKKIWDDLRNYASSSSYVSFDTGEEATPQLHSDVIVPMRILLEAQEPIFKRLHTDAAAYFESKAAAEKDPEVWARYVSEIIYHRFQSEGATAAAVWREKLGAPAAQINPDIREILAEEITGNDYVDGESNQPIRRADDTLSVNPADLYEAHLRVVEALIASIANATRERRAAIWRNAGEHFNALRQLDYRKIRPPATYKTDFDEQRLRRLTKQINQPKPNYQKTISLLRDAMKTTRSQQMLVSFEILLADMLADVGDEESLKHYDCALKIIESAEFSQTKLSDVRLRVGAWYSARSDFVRAEKIYREVMSLAKKEKNTTGELRALRALADLTLELGRYDESVKFLERVRQTRKLGGDENPLLDAFFLSQIQGRNLFDPLPALRRIEPFLTADKTVSIRAAVSELHGDLLGMMLEFDDALAQLEKAKELWTSASNFSSADRARMLRISLAFFEIGNYTTVASLLGEWEQSGKKTDLELTCHIRLLRVLSEYRNDNQKAARDEWQKIRREEKFRQSIRCSIRILATGLALNFGDDATAKELIAELTKITPAAARLPLLGAFKYAELPFDASSQSRLAIKNLVYVESKGRDVIPHTLIRADVLDCCGETAAAERLLNRAAKIALKEKNSFAYREILLALDRLGTPPTEVLFDSEFLNEFSAYPNLCAASCIEQAERFLKRGETRECRESLAMAQERLPKKDATTHQLEARLNEIFGQAAHEEGNAEVARFSFNSALSVYKKLGNKPAAKRMADFLPRAGQTTLPDEEIYSVRIEATAKTLTVESFSGKNFKARQKFNLTNEEYLLKTIVANIGDVRGFDDLSDMFSSDLFRMETQGGIILFSKYIAGKLKENYKNKLLPDFKLDSLTPSLAKMPWELARLDNRSTVQLFRYFYRTASHGADNLKQIIWLQTALRHLVDPKILVDGNFGLQTETALKTFKRKFNLLGNISAEKLYARIGSALNEGKSSRHTKVLLIRPQHEQQIRSQRGLDFFGTSIEQMYQDSNFEVETLWWSDINYLKDSLKKVQPDVVHIQSSFRMPPNIGQIYLNLGFEPGYAAEQSSSFGDRASVQPSTAFLNDALALLPDSKLRPLIILDAICPLDSSEVIRQLLYRNSFAAELFQFGNASGIVAMGLCSDSARQATITENLIRRLSNSESFGATVNALKKLSPSERLEEKVSTLGIALYTNDPTLTVLSAEQNL